MNVENKVVALCVAGTRAELAGRIADACALYQQAWGAARNDYEACIAAHYRARHQQPEEALRWNQEALRRAEAVGDARITPFLGSLYVNLGHSYELLGHKAEAERFYRLAAEYGVVHQQDEKGPGDGQTPG